MSVQQAISCQICGAEIPARCASVNGARLLCLKCDVTIRLERAGFKNPVVDEEHGWALVCFEPFWKSLAIDELRGYRQREFWRRFEWRNGELRPKEGRVEAKND